MSSDQESSNDKSSLARQSAEAGGGTLSLDRIVRVQDTMIQTLFGLADHMESNMKTLSRDCANWNGRFNALKTQQDVTARLIKGKVEKAIAELAEVRNTLEQAGSSGRSAVTSASTEMDNNQSLTIPQASTEWDQRNLVRDGLEHDEFGNGVEESSNNASTSSVVVGVTITRRDVDSPVAVGSGEESSGALISQPGYQARGVTPSTLQTTPAENNPGQVNQSIVQLDNGLLLVDLQYNEPAQNLEVENGQGEAPSSNMETPGFYNQLANNTAHQSGDDDINGNVDLGNGREDGARGRRKSERVFQRETSSETLVEKRSSMRANKPIPLKKAIKKVKCGVESPPSNVSSEEGENRRITRSMVRNKSSGKRTRP